VAAIEPHPTSVQVLNENLGLNGIKNVRVLPLACWSGRAALRSVDSSLLALHAVAAQEGQDGGVRGLPLDEIVEELAVGRVDWIKIDVEGAELAVLEGARETIERFRPNLFVEIHQTLPSIRDWIFKNHYVIRHHNEDQHTAGWGWIVATPPLKPQANLCSPAAIAESIAR
jgi:FkbM family methyltransferase